MKKDEHTKKKKKFPFLPVLLVLLAVVCVAGVELLVCSYQDPALYERLTAPVRAAVHQMAETGQQAWDDFTDAAVELGQTISAKAEEAADSFHRFLESLIPEPEEEEEDLQLVDNEAVVPPPRPIADYAITSLQVSEGQEVLTGGARDTVYFDQTSERWAEERYGTDPIGGYGCGPTAMAMVAATLAGADTDPARMAQYCVDHGYWSKKHGSYWSIVPGVAEDYGLTCTSLPPEEVDRDEVIRHLVTGDLLVALMGPGHFTNGGHFIVLRGVTLDGSILVADPASLERSLTTWDLDLILEELSSRRNSGGPLWIISPGFPQ